MRRGFTIVELLTAVAIVAILLGLSATAVTGAIKKARAEQAKACVMLINQGASVYYATYSKWPGSFQTEADSAKEYHELTAAEVRAVVKALVDEARMGCPPMDISGLYVSRKSDEASPNAPGLDFLSAIRGTKKSGKKMSSGEMWFGYPNERGFFRGFHAQYYPRTDRLEFSQTKK